MIALVDYGAGNLASVRKALRACGADVVEPVAPADLDAASAIVLPGVGHFAATASLDGRWRAAIRRRLEAGVPFLGICLGMQWLFEGSDEAPSVARTRLAARPHRAPAGPHAGWTPGEGAARRLERRRGHGARSPAARPARRGVLLLHARVRGARDGGHRRHHRLRDDVRLGRARSATSAACSSTPRSPATRASPCFAPSSGAHDERPRAGDVRHGA